MLEPAYAAPADIAAPCLNLLDQRNNVPMKPASAAFVPALQEVDVLVADKDSSGAQRAMAALVQALIRQQCVAVLRMVARGNSQVR